MKIESKKAWLDYLYYDLNKQRDFDMCIMSKDNGEVRVSKWHKYSEIVFPIDVNGKSEYPKVQWFFEKVNNRQILPCEVVLDIEDPKLFKPIINKLDKQKLEYFAYKTGSRGYHIHLFYDADLTPEQKLKIITEYKADKQKAGKRCMIALEEMPHWKTGRPKVVV